MPGGKGKSTGGKAGPKEAAGKSQKSHSAKAGLQVRLWFSSEGSRGEYEMVCAFAEGETRRFGCSIHIKTTRPCQIVAQKSRTTRRDTWRIRPRDRVRSILKLIPTITVIVSSHVTNAQDGDEIRDYLCRSPEADQLSHYSFRAVVSSVSSRTTRKTRCVSAPRVSALPPHPLPHHFRPFPPLIRLLSIIH